MSSRLEALTFEGEFSVVIPARNEAENLPATLAGLGALRRHAVVVDDGSSDATADLVAEAGIPVISLKRSHGKGHALMAGVAFAVRAGLRGHHGVLFLDADVGESVSDALAPLLDPVMKDQCDLAIARYSARGSTGGRGLVVRLARVGIESRTGWVATVPLSGIRAMNWTAYSVTSPLAPGWGVETGMTIDALRAGLRVQEVDTKLTHRATGTDWRGQVHRGRQYFDVRRALLHRASR